MIVGTPTKLNLIPSGVMPVVYINQGDAGYDKEFLIYNGDTPYNVPSGVSATIRGTKADNYGVTEAAEVTTGSNLVTVTITEQMVAAAGKNLYELVFVDTNGLRVASINMVWAVKKDALGDSVISDSDLDYATQVMNQLQSVQAFKIQLDANTNGLATETAARIAADHAETTARVSADSALINDISTEAATRLNHDNLLQSQIDQLIAPTGTAPSAAEVQNARIGADGVTYQTLGDAIRGQVEDINNDVAKITDVTDNIFDPNQFIDAGWTIGDNDYYGAASGLGAFTIANGGFKFKFSDFKLNARYIISLEAYHEGSSASGNAFNIRIKYTDGTQSPVIYCGNDWLSWKTRTVISTSGKSIESIGVELTSLVTNIWHFRNISVAEAKFVTSVSDVTELYPYKPYKLYADDDEARTGIEFIEDKFYEELEVKWLHGRVNANGTVTALPCAVAMLPKGTRYIDVNTSVQASFGFYDLNGAYIGKLNALGNMNSVSGDWGLLNGKIDIQQMLIDHNAVYCSANIIDARFTNDRIASEEAPLLCQVYGVKVPDDNNYPAYHEAKLMTAIANAKADICSVGKNGFSFLFTTDNHWFHNAGGSPGLISAAQKDTKIQDVILGGDLIDGGENKATELSLLHNVCDKYYDANWNRRYCFGNHDSNTVGQTAYDERHFSQSEIYGATQLTQAYSVKYSSDGFTDYYWDNEACKTRIIVIDSKIEGIAIYTSQLDWLGEVLSSTPENYKIIIVMHIWYQLGNDPNGLEIAEQGQQIFNVVDAWNNAHTAPKVEAMFGGHVHRDANYTTTTGVPLVLTTCDCVTTPTQICTLDDQVIDVITIDYANKTIKCRRIGRGNDRTINY